MTDNIDQIFDEAIEELKQKSSDLNALLMEAKDLCAQYDYIKKDVTTICRTSSPTDSSILQLRERFYFLVKRINSLNKEIFDILFKAS